MKSRREIGLWITFLRLVLVLLVLYLRKSQVSSSSDVTRKTTQLISLLGPHMTVFGGHTKRKTNELLPTRESQILDWEKMYEDQLDVIANSKTNYHHHHQEGAHENWSQADYFPVAMNNETLNWTSVGFQDEFINTTKASEADPILRKFLELYPVEKWKTLGLFDEEYLEHINRFWLTFEPASPSSHHALAILYIIVMTVGCTGNLLVILMFICCRSLRTPANYLILNLAISDFGMLVKMPVFIINSFYEGPVLGTIGCQVYGFLGGLTGTCSIMTLTAIAVDRYYVIVHPLSPYKRTTHARAGLMIIAVWFYSGFFSSMPLIGINEYVSEGYLTSCSFDYLRADVKSRVFIFIFFLAAWLLPLSLISFSYIAIFRMVVQAEKMDFFNGANTRESFKYKRIKDKLRKEVKIAIITTFIVFLWILAWTPYAIVALIGIFGQKHLLTPFVSTLPSLFCKLSGCINPYIYSISHPRFQKELRLKINNFCNFRSVGVLRKCSAPSLSFDVSTSDVNSDFNTRKFDSDLDDDEGDGQEEVAGDTFNMTVRSQATTACDTESPLSRNGVKNSEKSCCPDDEPKRNDQTENDKVEAISESHAGSGRTNVKLRSHSESDIHKKASYLRSQQGTCKRTRSLNNPGYQSPD